VTLHDILSKVWHSLESPIDISPKSLIAHFHSFGPTVLSVLLRPRKWIREAVKSGDGGASARAFVSWALAFSLLVFSLNRFFFGSARDYLDEQIRARYGSVLSVPRSPVVSVPDSHYTEHHPEEYVGVRWLLSRDYVGLNDHKSAQIDAGLTWQRAYVAIAFLLTTVRDNPQQQTAIVKERVLRYGFGLDEEAPDRSICFQAGLGCVAFRHVDPSSFSRLTLMLLVLLYATVLSLCIFPIARLLGSDLLFSTCFQASEVLISVAILILMACDVLVPLAERAFRPGLLLALYGSIALELLLLLIVARSFFLALSEFTGFSKRLLFVTGVIAAGWSAILSPLLLMPCLQLLFWSRGLLDIVV
jgi:hypothetical protein